MLELLGKYLPKARDTLFLRRVWSIFLFSTLIVSFFLWPEVFELWKMLLIFSIFIFINVANKFLFFKLKSIKKDNHLLQYFDLFAIITVLILTNWKFYVAFTLYLFIIMAAFSYGARRAYIYAGVTGIAYSLSFVFFAVHTFNLQIFGQLVFDIISMLLTAYMGGFLKDQISAMEKSNEELNRRNSELFILQQTTNYVSSILNIDDLLQLIPDILLGVSGAKYAAIYLSEDGTFAGLKIKATNCQEEEIVNELFTGICGYRIRTTFTTGNPTIENYITCGEFGSMMNIPIKHKDELLGVVVLTHFRPHAFDASTLQLLMSVVNQLSVAIANARLYEKVRQMANIDGLTGIYNRKYLQDYLTNFFNRAEHEDLSIIMIDIDHFKRVNDTFGHLMGDHVLKILTEVVNRVIPQRAFSARYGGEEFVVILPAMNMEEAYKVAEELRNHIKAEKISLGGVTCQITISLGVAGNSLTRVTTMDELLNAVDEALYKAKETRDCSALADE